MTTAAILLLCKPTMESDYAPNVCRRWYRSSSSAVWWWATSCL